MNEALQMVDLVSQYERLKPELEKGMNTVLESAHFIGGPMVQSFTKELASFTKSSFVIPCANGTDALQIAFMALDLKPGDEVLVPAFTYIATVEVLELLKLKPVLVDVREDDFNMDIAHAETIDNRSMQGHIAGSFIWSMRRYGATHEIGTETQATRGRGCCSGHWSDLYVL
jgi:dTDP-4-amino-4,6-dideoxygalactose transaminase